MWYHNKTQHKKWQSQDPNHRVFQHLLPPLPADLPKPQATQQPVEPAQQVVHLNWSYFKPKFSGKPDEDAEFYLLCTKDWMTTYHFVGGVMVQRCCLTLLEEIRLWYWSLEPINIDWQGLQNLFRQQYSKKDNTREQLFHAWESFYFDENTETIVAYVMCIRQVATLLGYGEPKVHYPQNYVGYFPHRWPQASSVMSLGYCPCVRWSNGFLLIVLFHWFPAILLFICYILHNVCQQLKLTPSNFTTIIYWSYYTYVHMVLSIYKI